MSKSKRSHTDTLREVALQWLRDDDRYLRGELGSQPDRYSLESGLHGTAWVNDLTKYSQMAAQFVPGEKRTNRLRALQAAGRAASVGRALYAALVQRFDSDISEAAAHGATFSDLQGSFPSNASGLSYRPGVSQYPPLVEAMDALHWSLVTPVELTGHLDQTVRHGQQVGLAAGQLFMDHLVRMIPEARTVTIPRPGRPIGDVVSYTLQV